MNSTKIRNSMNALQNLIDILEKNGFNEDNSGTGEMSDIDQQNMKEAKEILKRYYEEIYS